jgi:hypothetical protein
LADGGAHKASDLVPLMQQAGWTSTSRSAGRVVEATLRKLASQRKVKALGKAVFELA